MKEAITAIINMGIDYQIEATRLRQEGDHIRATRLDKIVLNLRRIVRLAKLIYPCK